MHCRNSPFRKKRFSKCKKISSQVLKLHIKPTQSIPQNIDIVRIARAEEGGTFLIEKIVEVFSHCFGPFPDSFIIFFQLGKNNFDLLSAIFECGISILKMGIVFT